MKRFIDDFSPILFDDFCDRSRLLILRDFSYHVSKPDIYAQEFIGLLDCCGLKQPDIVEIHIKGNTLDLVMTRGNELDPYNIVTNTSVNPDHYTVIFGVSEK